FHAVGAVAELGGAVNVGAGAVAQHHVPARPAIGEEHAGAAVTGDDVGGTAGGAADGVRRGADLDEHAVTAVAEFGGAVDVGADAVAQHHVAARPAVRDVHTVGTVAGEEVEGRGRRAADGVVDGSAVDFHAVAGIAELGGAVDIGA